MKHGTVIEAPPDPLVVMEQAFDNVELVVEPISPYEFNKEMANLERRKEETIRAIREEIDTRIEQLRSFGVSARLEIAGYPTPKDGNPVPPVVNEVLDTIADLTRCKGCGKQFASVRGLQVHKQRTLSQICRRS